jgi:AcrR family transcriptional regulator
MHTRLKADERREEVISAAAIEFAAGGYAGTSTEAIARRAGVSQPYLFQLFGTKKGLFVATVRSCFERTRRAFEEAARVAKADPRTAGCVLEEMGHAYVRMLLADRNMLRLQLHAYAACGDADVQATVRDEFRRLWQVVTRVSGANPADVHAWFAQGMLINVIASIDAAKTLEEFDLLVLGGPVVKS